MANIFVKRERKVPSIEDFIIWDECKWEPAETIPVSVNDECEYDSDATGCK